MIIDASIGWNYEFLAFYSSNSIFSTIKFRVTVWEERAALFRLNLWPIDSNILQITDPNLSNFEMPNEKQFCAEEILAKSTPPSEEFEDKLLIMSDKIKALTKSESMSTGPTPRFYI